MGKIDIDISDSEPENLKKDIIEILSKSDLEFSDDKLSIKLLTGGSSNVMYLGKCSIKKQKKIWIYPYLGLTHPPNMDKNKKDMFLGDVFAHLEQRNFFKKFFS